MKAPAAEGASQNNSEAFIDDELTTCLLDNGAQLNFMTPDYAVKWDIHSGATRPRNWRGVTSHSRHRWD